MPAPFRKQSLNHSARGGSMFRRLTEARQAELTILVDGVVTPARPGDSVAAAMLAAGHVECRTTPISASPRDPVLGPDYWRGGTLVRAALESGAHHVAGASVWGLPREGELALSVAGGSRLLRASRVILATGALERP